LALAKIFLTDSAISGPIPGGIQHHLGCQPGVEREEGQKERTISRDEGDDVVAL
jgi:hypothetical protein